MSKTFPPGKIDEPPLLPPCVQDFVGEDRLPRFVAGLVVEHLGNERWPPPFIRRR